MNTQLSSESQGHFIITVEVVPEDPLDADMALVDAVGRDTADALRLDGYTIEPVYTGQRGGFLVDVVVPFFNAIAANRDIILADASELVTILTPVVLIARHLLKAHKRC